MSEQTHDHLHDEDHAHDHEHDHDHQDSALERVLDLIPFLHHHNHGEANVDSALEGSARGIWALKVSLLVLGATAIFQVIIAFTSGSVGLLADTLHNFSDALTAVPLWIAFVLGQRAANRRYTYGYGRAEDLAGVTIVGMIFASSLLAAYETIQKFIQPQPMTNVGWVMVAAVVGFIGNETVAILRMHVGKEIGSAALVADGQHAQIDGFTSLAVLFGAIGSLLGFHLADPIIGLLITIAILFIVKDTAVTMFHRLMDAIDPQVVDEIEHEAAEVPGVQEVHDVRVRWLGHKLQAELHIIVDGALATRDSHAIVEEVRHKLFHEMPRLAIINIHIDPRDGDGEDAHQVTAHHTGGGPAH